MVGKCTHNTLLSHILSETVSMIVFCNFFVLNGRWFREIWYVTRSCDVDVLWSLHYSTLFLLTSVSRLYQLYFQWWETIWVCSIFRLLRQAITTLWRVSSHRPSLFIENRFKIVATLGANHTNLISLHVGSWSAWIHVKNSGNEFLGQVFCNSDRIIFVYCILRNVYWKWYLSKKSRTVTNLTWVNLPYELVVASGEDLLSLSLLHVSFTNYSWSLISKSGGSTSLDVDLILSSVTKAMSANRPQIH